MANVGRFVVYNLLASLAAGAVAWVLVIAALRLLRVRSAFLHTGFLALPLIKSILVLVGIGFVLPISLSVDWYRRAIPPAIVLPFVLAWFALSLAGYYLLPRQARARILRHAQAPTGEEEYRLNAALDCVMTAYRKSPCCQAGETICCISDKVPENPLLLVSDGLRSPVAVVQSGSPVVVFPSKLISKLDDLELAMTLAHELNHFALREPVLQTSGWLWKLILVSPIAFLLADYLHREEEKACDDLAVTILGQPDIFAGMLVKSYQFAREWRGSGWKNPLPFLPQLLGSKAFITERIERLLEQDQKGVTWLRLPLVIYTVWAMLLYVLFFARFAS